jgi:hypothetical protein
MRVVFFFFLIFYSEKLGHTLVLGLLVQLTGVTGPPSILLSHFQPGPRAAKLPVSSSICAVHPAKLAASFAVILTEPAGQ